MRISIFSLSDQNKYKHGHFRGKYLEPKNICLILNDFISITCDDTFHFHIEDFSQNTCRFYIVTLFILTVNWFSRFIPYGKFPSSEKFGKVNITHRYMSHMCVSEMPILIILVFFPALRISMNGFKKFTLYLYHHVLSLPLLGTCWLF